MLILGIETSCDDTGVAILKASPTRKAVGAGFNILSNVISSQIKVHAKFGGVVPNLASREHLKNIEPCLKQAFREARVKPEQIDLIAVTVGPGLIPSLLIGVNFARALAYVWKKPIVGVNHIEAHILANWLEPVSEIFNFPRPRQAKRGGQFSIFKHLFPAIALVVSGGHTQLILMKDIGKYKILGETRDDAAGECFDKVAKLLGLGYPGGPKIAAEAAKYKIQDTKYKIRLPRPMIDHKNYDFSFSGLKTAVLYTIKDMKKINIPEICVETQQSIIDVLISKTLRAAKEYKVKTVILSGGVAANEELRKQFESKLQITNYPPTGEAGKLLKFLVPTKNLCTDNATMIVVAGYYNKQKATKDYSKVKANANLRIT